MSKTAYEQGLDKNPANYVPLSPLSFIERTAMVYPTRTSVVHGTHSYTWSETYARHTVAQQAHTLGPTVTEQMLASVQPGYVNDPSFDFGVHAKAIDLVAEVGGELIPFEVKYRAQHTGARELKGLVELCQSKRIERGYVVTKSLEQVLGFA